MEDIGLLNFLTELGNGVVSLMKFVLRLNYLLVEAVISMVLYWANVGSSLYEGVRMLAADLIDSYGDFCLTTLWAAGEIIHSVAMGLMLIVNTVLHAILHVVNFVVVIATWPFQTYEKSLKGADRLLQKIDRMVVYPVEILEMGVDGLVMIFIGIGQCCQMIVAAISHSLISALALVGSLTSQTTLFIKKVIILLITQPVKLVNASRVKLAQIPIEAVLGILLVCILFFLLRSRWLQSIVRGYTRFFRHIVVWVWRFFSARMVGMIRLCCSLAATLLQFFFPWLIPLRVGFNTAVCVNKTIMNLLLRPLNWLRKRKPEVKRTSPTGRSIRPLNVTREDFNDRLMCVVCQDSDKSVLLQPCNHVCLCDQCADHIYNHIDRRQRLCPVCRTHIRSIVNVYV